MDQFFKDTLRDVFTFSMQSMQSDLKLLYNYTIISYTLIFKALLSYT